jgi:serine/threonine protein kinase
MVIFGIYKVPGSEDRKNVAVKTSKPMDDGIDLFKALLSELKIMTYIGEHENIVNLIGACTQNIQKSTVLLIWNVER